MVSIVLASHGTFAEGIKMSGQMIFGPQDDVAAVTLMPEMGPDDLRAKLLEAVSGFENQAARPGIRSPCSWTRRATRTGWRSAV